VASNHARSSFVICALPLIALVTGGAGPASQSFRRAAFHQCSRAAPSTAGVLCPRCPCLSAARRFAELGWRATPFALAARPWCRIFSYRPATRPAPLCYTIASRLRSELYRRARRILMLWSHRRQRAVLCYSTHPVPRMFSLLS